MKSILPWILTAILAITLVAVVVHRSAAEPGVAANASERKVLYWVDPMHPTYKSDKPGKAPDCGMDLVPVYADGGGQSTSTVQGYANVSLPPARQQMIGVQTALAERRTIGRSVRAVGRVGVDETRLYKITTKFEGYIEKLHVNFTGQPVHRGEALFTIYSPELLATQQEYLLALRAVKQSPELLEASRQRLKLWDISDSEIRTLEREGVARKSLTISSPASGVVTVKNAVEGARVTPGDVLFEIADLERVWVVADVYEAEFGSLRLGGPAEITLSFAPGRVFKGSLSFIAPTVDPMTKTVKVRVDVDNRDGALKPEMFADVTLSEPKREVVAVPQSAVLNTGTRSIVFVVSAEGSFQPREVAVGANDGQFVEIRSGIEPGEKVATQANFLIDSESRLKAALQQMSGGAHGH
ncbi:MAG TPA: efflux RND transporter periplasmic adaptor subunit [Thermoanaerobaculia bacterium]|nr:efflux RND transporter periplasmic adaptor subunit [Thermoanaerobaculia bacterium]